MIQGLLDFFSTTGFTLITGKMLIMWVIAGVLLWLAIAKGFEPLLLVPIAFGALVANLPTRGVITTQMRADGVYESATFTIEGTPVAHAGHAGPGDAAIQKIKVERVEGGLFDFISQGIKLELFPPLIFLGVGALTDFGPLIAMPRTLLLGAAAQLGLFMSFMGAGFLGFTSKQAASIGIIGGADGPTAIFLTNKLAPELLGAVAVAAYSYMSLVPLIQPPIMRLLTTNRERRIRMKSLRPVSKLEKLVFAILVMIVCILLVPDASALIAMLMLGNFLRECGVTERLVKASQNEIINVLTIFLGTSVGITMAAESFLAPATLKIIVLGVVAFGFSTAGGVLAAKIMNVLSPHNPVNPLIGSAGVSAVPMAARVSHVEGQKYDSGNYLLMHAMGPNVAGVIGTAVAAGYFLSTLSH
jgi:carboxybiotin decarboxylase